MCFVGFRRHTSNDVADGADYVVGTALPDDPAGDLGPKAARIPAHSHSPVSFRTAIIVKASMPLISPAREVPTESTIARSGVTRWRCSSVISCSKSLGR